MSTTALAEELSLTDISYLFFHKLSSTISAVLPDQNYLGDKWDYLKKSLYFNTLWDEYVGTLYEGDDMSKFHFILEAILVLVLVKLLITPRETVVSTTDELTQKEIDDLVKEFEPEPLVAIRSYTKEESEAYKDIPIFKGKHTPHATFTDNKERLQFGTMNFLGLIGNPRVEESAEKAIRKYGVGSCGPRGFYGSIDVHQELELRLADFLGTEEAILYSYGFATIASAIPAYSKRGDVIYCDKGVSFATQKGLYASRSTLRWFNHNDMEDLEACMIAQDEEDQREPQKAAKTRRLIVVEGLYVDYGDICPLDEIVALKYKYKARLFLEESGSFGVIGKHGRGVTEHFGINVSDIDQICACLEYAAGSVGGFCAGSTFVIDHQRLGGSGYVFSASLPPLLASASITALDIMSENINMVQELARKSTLAHAQLRGSIRGMSVCGDDVSPIIHLRLQETRKSVAEQNLELQKIINHLWDNGIVVTRAKYITEKEFNMPQPSLRIAISVAHEDEEILRLAKQMGEACRAAFGLDD